LSFITGVSQHSFTFLEKTSITKGLLKYTRWKNVQLFGVALPNIIYFGDAVPSGAVQSEDTEHASFSLLGPGDMRFEHITCQKPSNI
jgi:hypothetical protein